jgi:RNase P subunit RPR2
MMIEEYIPLCKHCQSSALEIQGAKNEENSSWLDYECHSCGEFTRFHYAKDAVEGAEPIRIESSPIKNRSKL